MHDFILAKEIIEELKKIASERKILVFKKVVLEIGRVVLGHDGLPEHEEDVSLDNLQFAFSSLSDEELLKNTEFSMIKTDGNNWEIREIEI